MWMRLIKDENEMYDILEEQIAQLKIKPYLNVSIKGLDLSDEDAARIKSQIQQMVTPDLVKYQQARLQEAKIKHKPPRATAELVKHEKAKLRKAKVKKLQVIDRNTINVSLKGLPLPDEDTKRLESQIQQMVKRMLPREIPEPKDSEISENSPEVKVYDCAVFVYLCYPPGATIPLNDLIPEPPHPGRNYYLVAMFLPLDDCFPEDWLVMKVEDGAPFGLDPNEALVGLINNTEWAKEIWAWGEGIGTVSWIGQDTTSYNPVWMTISPDVTDTIFFKKARLFGLMGDMYNFDRGNFWTVFLGKRVTFTWMLDSKFRIGLDENWTRFDSSIFSTTDGDCIRYTIEHNAEQEDPPIVRFVLALGGNVTWRKVLNMPDGVGSDWDIVAEGSGASASNTLWAEQVNNGQLLTFSKTKEFGRIMSVQPQVGHLEGLRPRDRVTFTWLKD